jgi:hypothetical protein
VNHEGLLDRLYFTLNASKEVIKMADIISTKALGEEGRVRRPHPDHPKHPEHPEHPKGKSKKPKKLR